jgi:hypothetical protein
MLELSYRQAKRLWRRYRRVGRKGLKHGNAGRPSNRSKPRKLRRGRKPTTRELRAIFRLETERAIANDWVVRHEGRYLQLQPGQRRYGPTQSKALVCEWQDGTIAVYYRGERVSFTELKEPIRKPLRQFPPPPGPWW